MKTNFLTERYRSPLIQNRLFFSSLLCICTYTQIHWLFAMKVIPVCPFFFFLYFLGNVGN